MRAHIQTPLRSAAAFVALMVFLALPAAVRADTDDQDRARKAMLSGEVQPLSDLLAHVEKMYAGEIIEVELEESDDGVWLNADGTPVFLYEIKLLTPQGNLVKLEFDAKSLELLTVDGHDSESARKKVDKTDD